MDDLADRAPQFAAFFISPDREKVMKMIHMESVPIPNCNSIANKSGCFDLVSFVVITSLLITDIETHGYSNWILAK